MVKAPGRADAAVIERLVHSYVRECKLLSNVGAELSLQLPMSASHAFPRLFADIERNKDELGIETYGV